jgi:putative addiction module component (TIGR02574 family)
MSPAAEQVLHAAMSLPPSERAEVANFLWESVEEFASPEIAAAWQEEIAERIRALDAGELETIPAEEVHAQLKAKYGFFGEVAGAGPKE